LKKKNLIFIDEQNLNTKNPRYNGLIVEPEISQRTKPRSTNNTQREGYKDLRGLARCMRSRGRIERDLLMIYNFYRGENGISLFSHNLTKKTHFPILYQKGERQKPHWIGLCAQPDPTVR